MPPRRPPPSRRGRCATRPIWCWRRRGPGSARRWAISRPPRSGREQRGRGGVDIDLSPRRCNASWRRRRARLFPDAARAQAEGRDAQGPRELPVPAQSGGCAAGRVRRAARRSWRIWSRAGRRISADGDMVGGDLPGWLPTLFRRNGSDRADRPARRMRLCRLPALPQMLHRARRARLGARPTSSSPTMRW